MRHQDRIVMQTGKGGAEAGARSLSTPGSHDGAGAAQIENISICATDVPDDVREAVTTAGIRMEQLSRNLDISRHVHST